MKEWTVRELPLPQERDWRVVDARTPSCIMCGHQATNFVVLAGYDGRLRKRVTLVASSSCMHLSPDQKILLDSLDLWHLESSTSMSIAPSRTDAKLGMKDFCFA